MKKYLFLLLVINCTTFTRLEGDCLNVVTCTDYEPEKRFVNNDKEYMREWLAEVRNENSKAYIPPEIFDIYRYYLLRQFWTDNNFELGEYLFRAFQFDRRINEDYLLPRQRYFIFDANTGQSLGGAGNPDTYISFLKYAKLSKYTDANYRWRMIYCSAGVSMDVYVDMMVSRHSSETGRCVFKNKPNSKRVSKYLADASERFYKTMFDEAYEKNYNIRNPHDSNRFDRQLTLDVGRQYGI